VIDDPRLEEPATLADVSSGECRHVQGAGDDIRGQDFEGLDRRTFMALVSGGLLVAPLAAGAQQAQRMFRIGVLSPGSPPPGPLEAFRQGLHDLGYQDERNLTIEWRFAGGANERLPDLAVELVRLKVDVIVSINTQASLAVKNATHTIPVVIARVSDPVRTGLVASFASPGGNITGLTNFSDELSSKRLGLIREILPMASPLAVLWNTGNPGIEVSVREMERASAQVGMTLHLHGVKSAADFRGAFETMTRERVAVLFVFDDVLVTTHKRQILDWAAKVRLPVVSQYAEVAQAGGLMAYGPDIPDIYRRAATFVDKILKGAKPADLPVEEPTRIELVINLKTAKALGLTIPQSLLGRADQLIQ
jgi:putative tryptophan/tyrosine transport system substrate-binding protein